MSRPRFRAHPLVVRRVQVRRIDDLTARMRRITVGGEQLGAFTRDGMTFPAFATPMFDDHVKLIFAPGGDISEAIPRQREHGIDWLPSECRETRDYTPHHHDPGTSEVAFDFVLHTRARGVAGPAEQWARSARPGDDLWFVGPKASTIMPDDVAEVLLIGDETALPAISRFFAERPVEAPARAVIAVAEDTARQDIPMRAGDSIEWVRAAPGDRDALSAAVTSVVPGRSPAFVWAAAESLSLLPLRRKADRDWRIGKSHRAITGYWYGRDTSGAGYAGPSGGTDVDGASTAIGSPVGWMAIRAAVRMGMIDALADGPQEPVGLAGRVNVTGSVMHPLIAVLVDCGVLYDDGERIGLAAVGERLLDDEHAREEYDSLYADQVIALAGLADAIGTGRSAWLDRSGSTLRDHVSASAQNYAELVDEADGLAYLMPALARLPLWGGRSEISVGGPAAGVVVDGLLGGGVDASLRIVEVWPALDALRDENPPPGVEFADTWKPTQIAVLATALEHRTDSEVIEHLRELAGITDTMLLIESTRADGLNVRATEMALVHLGAVGVPPRTSADIERLARLGGWTVVSATPIGWGVACFELTPTVLG